MEEEEEEGEEGRSSCVATLSPRSSPVLLSGHHRALETQPKTSITSSSSRQLIPFLSSHSWSSSAMPQLERSSQDPLCSSHRWTPKTSPRPSKGSSSFTSSPATDPMHPFELRPPPAPQNRAPLGYKETSHTPPCRYLWPCCFQGMPLTTSPTPSMCESIGGRPSNNLRQGKIISSPLSIAGYFPANSNHVLMTHHTDVKPFLRRFHRY